jgi:hypothetical protein
MWFNGFVAVIDLALREANDAALTRQRETIIWGALREDVWFLPWAHTVVQNPSLSHFQRRALPGGFVPWLTPSASSRTQRCAQSALAACAKGDFASAFVRLGRAAHPLIDMSCPVHAQGVAHGDDAFEWAVEAMAEELRALAVPRVAPCTTFGEATARMAAAAQDAVAGRIPGALAREQARHLVPLAAAHTAQLFALFARSARQVRPLPEAAALPADALEMSARGKGRWLAQILAFAHAHGGRRHYARLMDLVDARALALESGSRS